MAGDESEPELDIIREPKVYLLGRQIVDEQALAEFLVDHQVDHWTTDTPVAGEKLIETAGRVCYMSFQRPRRAETKPISAICSKSGTARCSSTPFSTCSLRA